MPPEGCFDPVFSQKVSIHQDLLSTKKWKVFIKCPYLRTFPAFDPKIGTKSLIVYISAQEYCMNFVFSHTCRKALKNSL